MSGSAHEALLVVLLDSCGGLQDPEFSLRGASLRNCSGGQKDCSMWTEIPQWEFFLSRPLLDLSGKVFLGLDIWRISRVLEGPRGPARPWKWQSLVQVESNYASEGQTPSVVLQASFKKCFPQLLSAGI